MNYILCEYTNKNEFDAGNKARSDVARIANKMGYIHIPLFQSGANKLLICMQLIKGTIRAVFKADKGDNILLQYPYYPNLVNTLLFGILNIGKHMKGYFLSIIIHDVAALRNENYNTKYGIKILSEELKLLSIFDKIICHNESMAAEFKKAGFLKELTLLGPFDYLYDKSAIKLSEGTKTEIIIAGNLNKDKSGYIYKLPHLKKVKFNLYGVGYNGTNNECISYIGKYPPDELIENLKGNYGLVWDGNSIDTCDGVFGQYLRYNNPHKLSLYLAAGLPIILWSQSALANYVLNNHIGIVVESLDELDEKITQISNEEYKTMRNNVLNIREDIVTGKQLEKALR